MAYSPTAESEPTREEVDQMTGLLVLEFGSATCPHCLALQPDLEKLLGEYADVRHIKIEDGRGKPLGRSFRVKLWPTLVFMSAGQVIKQVARPNVPDVRDGLAMLSSAS